MSQGLKERLPYAKEGFTKHVACEMTPELPRRTEDSDAASLFKKLLGEGILKGWKR